MSEKTRRQQLVDELEEISSKLLSPDNLTTDQIAFLRERKNELWVQISTLDLLNFTYKNK